MLNGYKTYGLGFAYLATFLAQPYFPEVEWDTVREVMVGLGLVTLRHAVTTETAKV